jgi:hypothetical protein
MPQVMIYVFKEPRRWKNNAGSSFPFMFDKLEELHRQVDLQLNDPAVYHVTAFSTYGEMIYELYRSQKTSYEPGHGKENR